MHKKIPLKHPVTLWHMSYTYAFATFAYGMINSLLILFLRNILNFNDTTAYGLFAAFNALIFTLPVIGGYLAEKLGYKVLTYFGLVFCSLGSGLLAFKTLWSLYAGLSTFALGIAIAATTFPCIVDFSYKKDGALRHSAFTIFYLMLNLGFLFSIASGGFIVKYINFTAGFLTAAVVSLIGILFFYLNTPRIKLAQGRTLAASSSHSLLKRMAFTLFYSLLIITACALLLRHLELINIALWSLVGVSIITVVVLALRQTDKVAKYKLFAFILLSILSVVFWSLYSLEPSLLTVFIANNVDRTIFGFTIPAESFYSLDSINIIIFGIILSLLWRYLARRGNDLHAPTKFALSILSMGIGYGIFMLGIRLSGAVHLINMSWIVFGYLFLSISELLIAPTGLAMVGRLSPKGKEGLLMGIWQVFIGLASIISAYLADLTVTPQGAQQPLHTNPIYAMTFSEISVTVIIIGIIAVIVAPFIRRLIS